MAIRRTADQKSTSESPKVSGFTYSLPPTTVKKSSSAKTQSASTANPVTSIIGYPVSLIYQDIVKTLLVTVLVLAVLGGIIILKS